MKYAGVPAYLSYTAAAANALNRTAADEGPVADWLGADLLPEGPPKGMLHTVALYEGRKTSGLSGSGGARGRAERKRQSPYSSPVPKGRGAKGGGGGGGERRKGKHGT